MVPHLGEPLSTDVFIRCWADKGEADQEDIRLWVREWPQPVVILLSSSIPKPQIYRLAVNHHVGRIVIKHSGDVFSWEGIGGIADKETGFSHSSISHHDTLDGLHVLRPVVEDSAWGKGKSGQGKQPVDTGKLGYQTLS